MKSETEIYLDYTRAIRNAEKLDSLGEEIRRSSTQFAEQIQTEINTAWRGENSKLFCSKINRIKAEMDDFAKEIVHAAEMIRSISINIYNAEMRALEIARTRESQV